MTAKGRVKAGVFFRGGTMIQIRDVKKRDRSQKKALLECVCVCVCERESV